MKLSENCQSLVDALPPVFDESSFSAYEELIDTCGTHYLDSAIVGCKFQYRHFTGAGKEDVLSEGDVNANAGLDFLAFLESSGDAGVNASGASENYLSATTNMTSCFGAGSTIPCPNNASSFSAWMAACPSDPAFISGKFKSIGGLIRDPPTAASFAQAQTNHFHRAFLADEFIPFLDVVAAVTNSPLALNDTGGNCSSPPVQCPDQPPPATCGAGQCFNWCADMNYCNVRCADNPLLGNASDVAAMVAQVPIVMANKSQWGTDLHTLSAQAKRVLVSSNVVPNGTIESLSTRLDFYRSRVQLPVVSAQCGWTETVFLECSDNWLMCLCSCSNGSNTTFVQRRISFLSGLVAQ